MKHLPSHCRPAQRHPGRPAALAPAARRRRPRRTTPPPRPARQPRHHAASAPAPAGSADTGAGSGRHGDGDRRRDRLASATPAPSDTGLTIAKVTLGDAVECGASGQPRRATASEQRQDPSMPASPRAGKHHRRHAECEVELSGRRWPAGQQHQPVDRHRRPGHHHVQGDEPRPVARGQVQGRDLAGRQAGRRAELRDRPALSWRRQRGMVAAAFAGSGCPSTA